MIRAARWRQRGIAAVELAVVLPLLVLMLAFPVYLGRVLWHYAVIQQAAQDGARYLSKAPLAEMSNPARAAAVASVAEQIVAAELAELAPGSVPYIVSVMCDGRTCGGIVKPANVRVGVQVLMQDFFFPGYTVLTLPLIADVNYPYLGR